MTERIIRLSRPLKSVSLGDPDRPVAARPVPQPAPQAVSDGMTQNADETNEDAWRQLLDQFRSIDDQLGEIEQRRQQSLVEMQQAAIELAVAIASRILHETIEADELAIENVVTQILAPIQHQQPVTVRLHPRDLALLKQRVDGKPAPWQDYTSFQLTADAALQRGECRLDAGDFGILSQIELQLAEIRQHLLEALDHAQIERRRPQTENRALRRFPDRRETA